MTGDGTSLLRASHAMTQPAMGRSYLAREEVGAAVAGRERWLYPAPASRGCRQRPEHILLAIGIVVLSAKSLILTVPAIR